MIIGVGPSDSKEEEDFAMYNLGMMFAGIYPGQWADAEPWPSPVDPVSGYLIEYDYSPVPEPISVLLFSIGVLGLAGIKSKSICWQQKT
jgi:hypothetical protein